MKYLSFLFLSLFFLSCASSDDQNKDNSKNTKDSIATEDTNSNVKMAETSALSHEMRAMEQQMKWIKKQLDTNGSWSNEIFIDFHTIDTLQASDHVNQNEQFKAFSSTFRNQYSLLIHEKQSPEQFSMVINECINCHEVFCPGPIPRIKKLDN